MAEYAVVVTLGLHITTRTAGPVFDGRERIRTSVGRANGFTARLL
jgi:hypothetical protein